MINEYDSSNPHHEKHLEMLYKKVFGEEVKSDDNQWDLPLVNDDWKDIGF